MWANVQCVDSVLGMQALCPMMEITGGNKGANTRVEQTKMANSEAKVLLSFLQIQGCSSVVWERKYRAE